MSHPSATARREHESPRCNGTSATLRRVAKGKASPADGALAESEHDQYEWLYSLGFPSGDRDSLAVL